MRVEIDPWRIDVDSKTPCFFRDFDECRILTMRHPRSDEVLRLRCRPDCDPRADCPLWPQNGGRVEVVAVVHKPHKKAWREGGPPSPTAAEDEK